MRQDEKEALEQALQGLNGIVMTPPDDPKLSALKADIRRAIQKPRIEKWESGKASRQK
jgi:hypothetical protein